MSIALNQAVSPPFLIESKRMRPFTAHTTAGSFLLVDREVQMDAGTTDATGVNANLTTREGGKALPTAFGFSYEMSVQSNSIPESDIQSSTPPRRGKDRTARRHSTQTRVVYPIAESTGGLHEQPPIRSRKSVRRSVSARLLKRSPRTKLRSPPLSGLSPTSAETNSNVETPSGENDEPVNAPSESPYDEMMVRFQIRQLQRAPANVTMYSEDHRGLVGSNRSSRGLVGSSRGYEASRDTNENELLAMEQEQSLHSRLSARRSDSVNSINHGGAQPVSFQRAADRTSSFASAHPRFESGTSSAQEFNLAFRDFGGSNGARTVGQYPRLALELHALGQHRLFRPISPYSRITQVRYVVIWMATLTYVLWFPLELAFPEEHQLTHTDAVVGILLGLDVLITVHTGYATKSGTIITSHRQIAWHYLKSRLILDVLLVVPLVMHVYSAENSHMSGQWSNFVLDGLSVERLAYITQFARMIWLLRANQSGRANNLWAWLLYSRYSHLLRIAAIVTMLVAIAHYNACIWTVLLREGDEFEDPTMSWHEQYSASFYAALLLLQGEGVPTDTTGQNVFASLSTLMGSIVLAVVFGHVAILVSNFNANFTNYQRKMEAVVAMTAKLQLPPPLRERIHEYYEHLWHEYECLDGEVVQFSKELSHTLALEVVLFKYMELVMHVPFWKDCTPDFQKQLMLRLDVRVYLPDDFIMRQGEVDDECYMVNRGYCELSRDAHRFERVTDSVIGGSNGIATARSIGGQTARRRNGVTHGAQSNDGHRQNAYELDAAQRQYYNKLGRQGAKGHESLIARSQAFGDLALLMNYQRAANVRAITHVEVCVLSRDDFQAVLTRYPEDRHRVVVEMLTSYMQSYEMSQSRCPLLELVREVYSPEAIAEACAKAGGAPPLLPSVLTARQAAERIYMAINVEMEDTTLKFGVGVHVREQLVELRERRRREAEKVTTENSNDPSMTPRSKDASSNRRFDCGPRFQGESTSDVNDSPSEAILGGYDTGVTTATKSPQASQPSQVLENSIDEPQPTQQLTLKERLKQVEEREIAILRVVQELQTSLKVLRARQSVYRTAAFPSRKRSAPGDDTTLGSVVAVTRQPLLKRMVSLSPSSSLDTTPQLQEPKVSTTHYADQLFNPSTPNAATQCESAPLQTRSNDCQQCPRPSLHPIPKTTELVNIPSEIDTLLTVSEFSVLQASVSRSMTLKQLEASSRTRTEAPARAPHQRRRLFDRKASQSLRVLGYQLRDRTASTPTTAPVAAATVEPPQRRKFFHRTHGQKSLRTLSDVVMRDKTATQAVPALRASMGSLPTTNGDIFQRMSAFVTDNLPSTKDSPTRYADELFRMRSKPPSDALDTESGQ